MLTPLSAGRGPVSITIPGLTSVRSSGRVAGNWLHEIKHDGFRVIAHKESNRVRLYSRPGNDLT